MATIASADAAAGMAGAAGMQASGTATAAAGGHADFESFEEATWGWLHWVDSAADEALLSDGF
ncbi:hypothetical protein MNEG_12276 [Monoraphidium neglectum]|uniref:Uncharacterized protein n=1 Tax=Monoraphidium neglectum TaxID=145388 RepID=A0A0D2MLJ2_9CHLO|nr:hypothetical protein MNEG_12276 [Monoraphidium neglectum]KIY95685.1 hypothetical protein MNEG_12276 [Monoraphidium neglectum]|eukprot:XP_013894705.1 hypothetical protein MNEG_12276 [Monoraphidium neglectum]